MLENVKVGAGGEIVAPEGVTLAHVFYGANGEKEAEHRWENINVDNKGCPLASEGVTKTIIEFNAEGVKKGETRWENVKTNSNANVMASISNISSCFLRCKWRKRS